MTCLRWTKFTFCEIFPATFILFRAEKTHISEACRLCPFPRVRWTHISCYEKKKKPNLATSDSGDTTCCSSKPSGFKYSTRDSKRTHDEDDTSKAKKYRHKKLKGRLMVPLPNAMFVLINDHA